MTHVPFTEKTRFLVQDKGHSRKDSGSGKGDQSNTLILYFEQIPITSHSELSEKERLCPTKLHRNFPITSFPWNH